MNCSLTISSSRSGRNWRLREAAPALSKKWKKRRIWRRSWSWTDKHSCIRDTCSMESSGSSNRKSSITSPPRKVSCQTNRKTGFTKETQRQRQPRLGCQGEPTLVTAGQCISHCRWAMSSQLAKVSKSCENNDH